MADVIIPSIVEGHGEVKALPVLLRRLLNDLAPHLIIHIPEPIRVPKGSFWNRSTERKRAIELAALNGRSCNSSFILMLFDADDECPAAVAPGVLASCREVRPDFSMALILAKWEFESWFLAAAESLRGKRMLPRDLERPEDPEQVSDGKGWIRARRSDSRYSETIDQPAYCQLFNFEEARRYSPSFDKFHRDITNLLRPFSGKGDA